MAIAWRRGLFRVWALASVLWVLVVAGFVAFALPNAVASCMCVFIEDKGERLFVQPEPGYHAAREAYVSGGYEMLTFTGLDYVTLFARKRSDGDYNAIVDQYAPLASEAYDSQKSRYQQLIIAWGIGIAIALPLLVFLVGGGIAWAASGFRRM